MSKGKRHKIDGMVLSDFQELREMGYAIRCRTWYHYQIRRGDEDENFLDIYPTTRVYCFYKNNRFIEKGSYENLIDVVETKMDDFAKITK